MVPGEIYKLEKNNIKSLEDIKYIKFKDIKKDNDKYNFTLTSLNKENEKNEIVLSGNIVFDLISANKMYSATYTDKAKIVLMVKGF
jgi:hypothetical protein